MNRTRARLPRAFMTTWLVGVFSQLKRRRVRWPADASELVIAFVGAAEMRRLNKTFRGKDKTTDVLSFSSDDPVSLGELVICIDVIRRQAREHGLAVQEELGYMILHGVLHLLGYDHEAGERKARVMFALQDEIFEELCAKRANS